jgi:hypothetical protein
MNFRTAGHAIVGCLLSSFPLFFLFLCVSVTLCVGSLGRPFCSKCFFTQDKKKETKSLKVSGEMFFCFCDSSSCAAAGA